MLHLNTRSDESAVVRGIEMGFVPAPLHRVHVRSDMVTWFFKVGVCSEFPVDGIDFIMGNDIAGGKVYPIPKVVDVPVHESHDDVAGCYPDVFVARVLTRAQAHKKVQEVNLADSILGSVLSKEESLSSGGAVSKVTEPEKAATTDSPVLLTREALLKAQKSDPSLAKCWAAIVDKAKCNEKQPFFIEKNVLMRRWVAPSHTASESGDESGAVYQVVLPGNCGQQVLALGHENVCSGHLGIAKTYNRVLKHFFWPGMRSEIARFCRTCPTCQIVGKPNQPVPLAPLQPIPAIGEPFEHVLVDCVGPLPRTKSGNQFLLTLMCIKLFPFVKSLLRQSRKL